MNRAIIVFLSIFLIPVLYGQPNPGVTLNDYNTIENAINGIYGTSKYDVSDIVNIDSSVGRKWVSENSVEDPYSTLRHCYIFVAVGKFQGDAIPRPKGIIGVFKNGQIIWHSDSLVENDMVNGAGFFDISDINRDNKVEISTSWREGNNSDIRYLWIFGWNGSAGTLLNDVDSKGKSVICYLSESLEIVDINGDGIQELQGLWYDASSNEVSVIYSWNGQKYGNYSISTPPSGISNPKNKVDVDVKSQVKKNDKYEFSYTLINKNTSLQKIENFFIQRFSDSISNISTRLGWRGDLFKTPIGIMWTNLLTSDNYIMPGDLDTSFKYLTSSLPTIVTSYVQGNNGENGFDEIISNSVQVNTIGPADPPNPFVLLNFLDTLSNYTTQSRTLGWIKDQPTANKYLGYFASAKTKLIQSDSVGARIVLLQVLHDVDIDSSSSLSSEAYALLRFNTEYLANLLPQSQTQTSPFYAVKLVSSIGTKLTGGSLQYYEGSWKDAVNNNDGTFSIASNAKTLSLRMTYEYGTQTKSNVSISNDTIVFQTVNAAVQLKNSLGNLIDQGTVQYYSGAWRAFGTTNNGTANKELLPNNYSFRMTFAFASKDKQQDIITNPTVVFQTVNAAVQLQNSQGTLIDQGTVQYYSGAWRDFGTTNNGTANKELLPNSYSFRMTYAYASKDKQQDISTNPTVVFQTVNASVQLKNSLGNLIDQGTVQYYSGAWRTFGTTNNGTANKELLPNSYSFRMSYEFVSLDKSQDLSANSTVSFSTVLCTVRVSSIAGQLVDGALASYYSGAWRQIGSTINGEVKKELLPANLSFRVKYGTQQMDRQQNLSTNNVVEFGIQ